MKIFILGAKGMLGQELASTFSDWNPVALDKNDLDVTDFSALRNKIIDEKPDVVINAVALNAVDKIEESPEVFELAKKVNAEVPGEMAKICKEIGAIFVHYSSDFVFQGDKKNGYEEDALTNPVNKYGETKAEGEKAVVAAGGEYYIIRLAKLFGKPAKSEGAKKSFVDIMIWLATDGGKTRLEVVDSESGSPTYASDAAKLTKAIVENRMPYGIYHGANNGACTWYEWAKKIFELKKINVEVVPVTPEKFPRPARRPQYSELLNTKLPPARSWQEALKEYLV